MMQPTYCDKGRTIDAQCEIIEDRLNDLAGLAHQLKIPGSLHELYLCRIRDAVMTLKSVAFEIKEKSI